MKLRMKKKRISAVGRRTNYDVRAGKRIRVNNYGMEHFDDYWTSSSEGDSNASNPLPMCSSPARINVPRMSSFMKNMNQTSRLDSPTLKKGSNEKQVQKSVSKQITKKRQLLAKGRRTGANMLAGKRIRNIEGIDNFDDYWTDNDTLTTKINVTPRKKTASPNVPKASKLSRKSTHKEKEINQGNKNDIDVSSRIKKGKKKSLTEQQQNAEVESDVNQLRRSKRKRFPPMERWRLQRLRTVYDNFNIVTVEVEEGNEPITDEVDRIRKNHERYKERKKKTKSRKPKIPENSLNVKQVRKELTKTEVLDPKTGDEKLVYLHRPHDTLLWSFPPLDKKSATYKIAKCYSSDLTSFGFIEIGCGKKKGKQHSPEHNIAFYVIKGNNLKMTIHQSNFSLKELDFIVVPAGNVYSIVNKGKTDAILSFSTFKIPMFEYQFPNYMKDHD